MTAAAQTAPAETLSWDAKPATTDYPSSHSLAPTPSVIPKTVDYGHGHGMGSNEEHI